jgi:hypothetical protein
MGRKEFRKNGKGVACGIDHTCGLFLQIWDLKKGEMPDTDNILVDEDAMFTKLTVEKMHKILLEHGFMLDDITLLR